MCDSLMFVFPGCWGSLSTHLSGVLVLFDLHTSKLSTPALPTDWPQQQQQQQHRRLALPLLLGPGNQTPSSHVCSPCAAAGVAKRPSRLVQMIAGGSCWDPLCAAVSKAVSKAASLWCCACISRCSLQRWESCIAVVLCMCSPVAASATYRMRLWPLTPCPWRVASWKDVTSLGVYALSV